MHPLQMTARQMDWAAASLAHNLDFIADDKLRWNPVPGALSALEIVEHILAVLHRMTPLVGGTDVPSDAPISIANREDAKARLIEAAAKYSAMLRSLKAESLDDVIEWRVGPMPRRAIAMMPVNDMIHHHGQIAYLQMMLGDNETHRELSALME